MEHTAADLRWKLAPTRYRTLLVSDGLVYTSEQQFAPFRRFQTELRDAVGLSIRFANVDDRLYYDDFDIVGIKFSFRSDAQRVLDFVQRVRAGSKARIVYFDGDDDLNVQWPELLEATDLYVKKHAYRDRSDYAVARIGKSNLTDWVARHHGYSFEKDPITARSQPTALGGKVWVGWDIGLDDKIFRLSKRLSNVDLENRATDVCSRISVARDDWIYPLRAPVIEEMREMDCDAVVPVGRVSQSEYYAELLNSKICVSPFGYGELCWRDFEAMLCGCLLVKPEMSHVETAGDIFRAGETYAPVKWDYSDLGEVCAHYLAHPEERIAIAARARAMVTDRQAPSWFMERTRAMLHALSIQ